MPRRKVITVNWFKKEPKKAEHSRSMWQREQKDRKKRKNFRKFFFGLFLFGLITTFYFLNYFRAIVSNPFQPLPTTISYNSNPDKSYRVNILLISTTDQKELQDLALATYSAQEGSLRWLKIPTHVYLNLPSDYGWGDLKSAYLLGQTETKQKGADVLVRGVELLLAAPIDGYIALDDGSLFTEETLDKTRNYLFSPGFFIKSLSIGEYVGANIHTSLTPWSLLNFSWSFKQVRFDKAIYKDLAQYLTEGSVNGEKYPILDTLSLDDYLKDVLADPKIMEALAKIEVRNSTKKPGLASLATRVVTNLGGIVVYTGNGDDQKDKTEVLVYGKKDNTSQRLGEILGAKVEERKPDNTVRGDIVIQVGLDFFERLRLQN